MRRSQTERVGGVVASVLQDLNLDKKLREVRLMKSWDKVLGKTLSAGTLSMYIRNRVLFVKMRSSVARSELMMYRSAIVKALNDEVGASVIDDLVLS